MSSTYFVGVDVGTGSVRAALVTSNGEILRSTSRAIATFNPRPDFYEQSSEEIWNGCLECVREITQNIPTIDIKGIGFDATCSLVVLDKNGNPLTASPTGNPNHNVILWLDHRAKEEAELINRTKHSVLKYVGGKISLEMETPKLLWLKNHIKDTWNKTGYFFDLPDFLTWRATGYDTRSLCSLVCKWTYEVSETYQGWNESYFQKIGLEDLTKNWTKIGREVLSPGTPVGRGLSENAANELGLMIGTPVGTSIIDAHAGGLGLLGCSALEADSDFQTRLSLICGTSTCHMAVSKRPIFSPGVWGPYYSALIPGFWLNEGGQSATGKLIDHIITTHPYYEKINDKIGEIHIQEYLSNYLETLAQKKGLKSVALLTKDFHMWPDFHGNRSPLADSSLKGMICGLTLADDEESLAIHYLATIQSLAYGTKHIIENLKSSGYQDIKTILICGGLSKNKLFSQTHADVVNLPVVCPKEKESVLLGAAILGACAARHFGDVNAAVKSMGGTGSVLKPDPNVFHYHNKKYAVFLKMYEHQMEYRNIMDSDLQ